MNTEEVKARHVEDTLDGKGGCPFIFGEAEKWGLQGCSRFSGVTLVQSDGYERLLFPPIYPCTNHLHIYLKSNSWIIILDEREKCKEVILLRDSLSGTKEKALQ